jgi:hypothetical protein
MTETFDFSGRRFTVSDANVVTAVGRAPSVAETRGALKLSSWVRRGTHEVTRGFVVERPMELWPTRPLATPDPVKRAQVIAARTAARLAAIGGG